ncbi:MAG: PqqD family protein [Labilithrix sp.]|nr:PqqD family protein [Labilithrix sp.]
MLLDFGRGEYFALDEIATEIWLRLEAGDALATVASRVAASHDVSESQAFEDIMALVRDMSARALVETTNAESASTE